MPVYDGTMWSLGGLDRSLYDLSLNAGILGVALFFMATGYLMPMMMERYSRKEFLLNRLFRIFPLLIMTTVVVGIFASVSQGIFFSIKSWIGSLTLSYAYMQVPPIMGVLWTLVIEVMFYCLMFCLGRITLAKVVLSQGVLLGLILLGTIYHNDTFSNLVTPNLQCILVILIGSTFYLIEHNEKLRSWIYANQTTLIIPLIKQIALVAFSMLIAYGSFHYVVTVYVAKGFTYIPLPKYAYVEPKGYLLIIAIFWGGIVLNSRISSLPKGVAVLADIVYPVYLLHVAIGLGSMVLLREYVSAPYLLVPLALIVVLVVSYVLHRTVEMPTILFCRKLIHRSRNVTTF